jgi:hypothetical protein
MAVNKPVGDNARKGAVKQRTQLKNPLTKTSTKRNKVGGGSWPSKSQPRNSRVCARRSNGQAAYRRDGAESRGAHWILGVGDRTIIWVVSGSTWPSA